jgi:putative restriction endonuclease
MRIALRTSGGRGEYELAGRQGEIGVDDLLDRDLLFELTPEITIDGHSAARRVQGKPRIRLEDSKAHSHAYAFLAGSLLLPQPKRALKATTTDPDFVRRGQYAVTDIDLDVATVGPNAVDLRPTTLWISNAAGLTKAVEVAQRMALVQALWEKARTSDGEVASFVRDHEAAVISGDHRRIAEAADAIRKSLDNEGDLLDELTAMLGLEGSETGVSSSTNAVPDAGLDEEIDPKDAARRAVAQWRKSVIRSAQGRAFSQNVRAAYGDRCAFSGDVLPKLPHTASAGVDGAHILPWARYELNTVRNGLCLNKLCHWAFDAGVLRLDFDAGEYVISVPDRVKEEGVPVGMTLDFFESLQGAISPDRLPEDPAERPAPNYLQQLNSKIFG